MKVHFLNSGFLLLVCSFVAEGQPYVSEDHDDLYDYDDTVGGNMSARGPEVELMDTPQFTSQAQTLLVNEGDTIKLPCMVDRLEGFVMLWKKNKDIIAVASQIIDKRVRLDESANGNHLLIGQANPSDAGVYTCQISAYTPTHLTHTVRIRVKPVISTNPKDVLIVTAGSSATLECTVVSGTPTPEVRWRRKERKLPTGEEEIVGSTLTFSEVSRHDAGHYLCLADNGFGPSPVQKEVRLEVTYAPEIEIDNLLIQTKHGEEEEIVCTVHAVPLATVTWLKGETTVDANTPNIVINKKHNHHTLTILSVKEDTIGQYSCLASNTLGQAKQTVEVNGLARPAIITSSMEGQFTNEYTLQWHATSRDDITQFQVSVRKEKETEWDLFEVEVEGVGAEHHVGVEHHGHLLLNDLQQATLYEARVASKNRFGFNQPGKVFIFGTKGSDPVQKQSAMTGAASSLVPMISTIVMIAILL